MKLDIASLMEDQSCSVLRFLVDNGYEGLYGDGCGCTINDLGPCGEPQGSCYPGYLVRIPQCEGCSEACFCIGPSPDVCPYEEDDS